jgi:GT2 family glycosyltransferase
MVKTAIVILNWNGLDFLKKFLGTVLKFSSGSESEVFVADNASSDESVKWIKENHPEVKIIVLDKNHGFAGGYNLALELIDAEYYILLNSDIEVTSGWLEPLVNLMDENPKIASCQPKILSYNKREQFEYAGAAGGFIDKYGYPFCRGRIFDVIENDSNQYDSFIDIFWSSGACMIVRSDAWKRCGGFDDSFFAHMEEIDLCWRFNKAGYRICYNPASAVYHVGGGSLPYNSPYKTFLNFRNSLFLLYKNLPEKSFHLTLFIRKLLDGVAAIMFLLKGEVESFRSVWKAHMAYYKNIDQLKTKREMVKKLATGNQVPMILNKSIVFEFYVKGKRTYSSLKTEN